VIFNMKNKVQDAIDMLTDILIDVDGCWDDHPVDNARSILQDYCDELLQKVKA
jgi:hypothetical protein